ncbi:hypothetical protein A5729_04785 [Mycobacterium vulneris]|nr:hypothetical protein A5729_04785 [Mycolicibacterium vulneris]
MVDDVFPDRLGLGDFLAQVLPGPSPVVPLVPGELAPEAPADVSPDGDGLVELVEEESEDDGPVVSAAATPVPDASAATSQPVTTMPL